MKKMTVLELVRKEKTLKFLLVIIVLAFAPYTAYASSSVNLNDFNYNSATGTGSANSQNNTANNQNNTTNNQNNTANNIETANTDTTVINQTVENIPIQQAEPKPQIEVMSMDTYPKIGFYYDFQDVPGFSSYNRINNPQIRVYKLFEANFFYLNGGFYSYKGVIYDYFNATDSQTTNYVKLLKSLGFKSVPGFLGCTYFEDFAEQVVTEFQTDPFYDKKNQTILIKETGDQFTWVLISNSSGPTPDSTTWENAKYAPCKEIRVYSMAPVDVDKTPIIELSAADIATVKAALAKDTAALKAIKNRTIDLTKISLSRLSSILTIKSSSDVLALIEQTENITNFGSVIANAASESKPVADTTDSTSVTIDGDIISNTAAQAANQGNSATAIPTTGAAAFAANVTNAVVTEKTGISPSKTEIKPTTPINVPPAQTTPTQTQTVDAPPPQNTPSGGAQTLANNVAQSMQTPTSSYKENPLVPLISKAAQGSGIGNGIKYVSMKGNLITYEYASNNAKSIAASYIELLTGSGFTKFISGTDSVAIDINEFVMISSGISEQQTTMQNAQIYKKDGTIVFVQSSNSNVFISFSTQ